MAPPRNLRHQVDPPVPPALQALPASLVANIRPPPSINVHGDRAEEWTLFDQQFTWFAAATSLTNQPEPVQIAVFMSSIGPEAVKEFNSLKLSPDELSSLSQIRSALQHRFAPKVNYRFERYQFNKIIQEPEEKFDKFLTRVMIRAKRCQFGTLLDDLIVDRIIFGIRDDQLRTKLLDIDSLTLAKASSMCRNAEACSEQVKVVNADTQQKCQSTASIAAIQKSGKPSSDPPKNYNCKNCGSSHPWRQCPAFNQICKSCGKRNHLASVCKSKQQSKPAHFAPSTSESSQRPVFKAQHKNVAEIQTESPDSPQDEQLFVNALTTDMSNQCLDGILYVNSITVSQIQNKISGGDSWYESLCLPNNEISRLKLDTGAQCNVLPLKIAQKLRAQIRHSSVRRIVSYGDGNFHLEVLGEINIKARFVSRRGRIFDLTFLIVAENVSPILGLSSCLDCGFIRRVLEIDTETWSEIKAQYQLVFAGLGNAEKFPYDIVLIDNPKLSICPARRIPFQLLAPVKKELDFMENLKVIKSITHPTPVVSPMVIMRKGGKIKIGIDPYELNKNLKRHHHPLKTVEEIAATIKNSKFFTVLDCYKGYWQIPLTKRTQDYLTFSTPWGRYSCLRLPYGIASAPEIFQRIMSSLFQDLPYVEISMDDILIHACTEEELKMYTRTVLHRIQEAGFKLNPQKCIFGTSKVRFLGHIFSNKGLCPDPTKIDGILALKTPSTVAELQRFLGSVTYLGKFIENLSELTEPLRKLLKKDVVWEWTEEQNVAFEKLKKVLVSKPVLKYYDVNKPVLLSVDASSKALGAVLLQDRQPVAYATKALTDSQTYLPQIEKEALAVRFACEKFHQYIFGKELIIETDHKPLESIFRKPIFMAPPRLKRILLDVLQYNPSVIYKKGKEIPLPDMLSRDCINQEPPTETDLEVLVVLPISAPALLEFQEATTSDPELPLLTETILHGWPDKINEVPPPIRKYFNFREDLSVHQNLVLKSDQIVVPLSLRPKMLKLIHQGHLGTTSCINRARSALFWLGMTEDINRFVTTCEVCQSTHKRKQPEPLITKPIPQRPWEIVATDIFQLGTKHFLLIADSYSGFVDYKQLTTLTSYPVIQALKYWFSIHGIPDYLDSDGGPQFSSAEFAAFAKSWHFTHRISSPHYPQSNGLAERNVATVKNILMKCAKDNSDPYLALLNWRNTPRSQTLQSPNERLMSRQTKTLLPVSSENLQPKIVSNVPDSLSAARQQQKLYADRRATPQPSFQQGESVLVQEGSRYWVRGRIVEVLPEPRSYKVETESGQIFRRNSSFIRHSSLPFFRKPTSNYTSANQTDQAPSSSIASRPRRTIKPPQRLNL
ncbi:hypothetical protein V9T40_008790 [Parthenolecanium corni]|uniref:RNA-directed DNA polymerase n=1 Tax=Parthenolecanium corni TaxID=536013 RepID=A0AAN9TFX9_9HEMI